MEERENNKGNQVLLVVIGIATLLIAMVGATFAYFSANSVQGNTDTTTITAQTAQYGNTEVVYDATYGLINTGLLDLPNSEQGSDYEYLMKFHVTTTATAPQALTVNWKAVTNTFCKYANGQNCTDNPADTDVRSEVIYDFYDCDATGYANTTASEEDVTVAGGCTKISSATSLPVPATDNTGLLHTAPSLPLAAGGTNRYVLVVTVKNLNTEQNYNQNKSFTGQVNVGLVVQ